MNIQERIAKAREIMEWMIETNSPLREKQERHIENLKRRMMTEGK